MKYAMDVKVNLKPVFSSIVHTGWWEGPCRVGTVEEGAPEVERELAKKQFETWKKKLQDNIDSTRCNILEPVYLEFNESFVVSDSEFAKLEKENDKTDIYLITYRVPGIEKLGKPVSMINLGPTSVDLVAYYTDIGLEAYMAHDFEEYNAVLTRLQVKKAVKNTSMLILSNTENVPVSVNSSISDLPGLFTRYGITNHRRPFKEVFDYIDKTPVDDEIKAQAKELIANAKKCNVTEEYLCNDLRMFHAVRKMLNDYQCNAFTIPCKELCACQLPQKYKVIPCMTHALNKDDRIPSACEEDINVLLAMIMMMYLTRKSIYMGNPVLVPAGSKTPEQLGMPKLLEKAGLVFDHDVLEIHHAVPPRKMNGFDEKMQDYEIEHFTTQGWGSHYQIDMAEKKDQIVTFARFNRRGDKMIVARAKTLGCEFRPVYCSPAVYYDVEGGVREFRNALAYGGYGHHLAVVYGDYVKDLQELGKVVGFEVEYFH